jgi:hypothetical protein
MITGQAWVGKGKVKGVLLRTDGGMVDMEQGSACALRGYGVVTVRSGKE